MPMFYEHKSEFAKIAIWKIAEEKNFFLGKVPLHRNIMHPHKQLQHLAGRYLLQYLFPDFPYHLIEIAETLKPFLPSEEFHFSISHCGDYAAAIVSKYKRVGIDVEMITPKVEKVKHKFLSEEELELVASCQLPGARGQTPINQLTLLWCCKEAVFKWYGKAEMDFKNHIHLKSSGLTSAGIINCDFLKEEKTSLQIQYKFFDGMCLAWIEN
jgi:phosphopantetheinyl transferase